MQVLITGGAGFVGSHVADRLTTDGHDVVLLDALLPHNGLGTAVLLGGAFASARARAPTSTPVATSRAARCAVGSWRPGWSARTRR